MMSLFSKEALSRFSDLDYEIYHDVGVKRPLLFYNSFKKDRFLASFITKPLTNI